MHIKRGVKRELYIVDIGGFPKKFLTNKEGRSR